MTGTAHGKSRTTHLVGYVSAGSPVSGASLRAYGPSGRRLKLRAESLAAKSNVNGFFRFVVLGRPRVVRVVARGGMHRRHRVKGSLRAIVRRPSLARTVYVDPVTTVIAAYAARHPRRPLAFAKRKTTRLLRLKSDDPIGRVLRSVTPHFNGRKFLRRAREQGGVKRYVAQLIDRDKPVSFRGAALPGGIADYVKLLLSAKDAVSAVATIGKNAYDFYRWVTGAQDTTAKIYDAVQKMQGQLTDIQSSLNQIQAEINQGFTELKKELDDVAYAQAIAGLKLLAGTISTTQDYFEDLVNNRLAGPPAFDKDVATTKMNQISTNMNNIVIGFQKTNDIFRDALLGADGVPAYYYKGQSLLSHSRQFMTPEGSRQLRNFADFVLQTQALAFNLIVHWEAHDSAPDQTLLHAVELYLGFDKQQAAEWVNAEGDTPTIPPSGDLHDELAYLDTIRPVPTNTVVQADALGSVQGPMWQAKDPVKVLLGRTILARPGQPGMGCADSLAGPLPLPGRGAACQYMALGWLDSLAQLEAVFRGLEGRGWQPATIAQTQALFTRIKDINLDDLANVLEIKPQYWSPADFTTRSSNYSVTRAGGKCDVNKDYGCDYYTTWIDEVEVTTLSPNLAKFKGTCRYGVGGHKGGDCPELYVLLRRDPDPTERYWPQR